MIKKGLLVLLLFCITLGFSQEKSNPVLTYDTSVLKVTKLTFSVDTPKELKSINWKDIKAIFENNKGDEKIELTFNVNLPESKNKISGSVTVGGESKNIDQLIKNAKKTIKGLIKVIDKIK